MLVDGRAVQWLICCCSSVGAVSVTGRRGVGIPIILLHDAEGGIVTIQLRNGDVLRGVLEDAQDNMNTVMKDVTRTTADGRIMKVDLVYLRGSQIVFYILPDMLSKAPMFNRITLWKKYKGHPPQVGIAKGQSAAIVKKSRQRRMQMQMGGDRGPRQR